MTTISVIIPAYNAESTLAATIASVLNQYDTAYKLEIIIVNDGSTDTTGEIAATFKEHCKIITTPNMGVSAARSTGYQSATGEFIQYLDSDDLLMPGKIKQQLDGLINNNADIAYGDWQKIIATQNHFKITETVKKQIQGDPVIDILTHFWCPPAAILYSKKVTDKISWSNTLPVIQDARYLLDAAIAGGKIIYTPGIQAQYLTGQSNSLSQRSSQAFVKDCFINASELSELWKDDLVNQSPKKDALIKVLRHCITEFSLTDKALFNQSINLLLELSPDYIPDNHGAHQLFTKLLGFKRAEKIAALKRRFIK